jgi:hypothetical protein
MTVRELLRVLMEFELEDEIIIGYSTPDKGQEFDSIVYVQDLNGPVLISREYKRHRMTENLESFGKIITRPVLKVVK